MRMDDFTCVRYGEDLYPALSLCDNRNVELSPIHFLDQPIEVFFDTPPAREKAPDCPNGFIWEERTYRVVDLLSAWTDFKRRGKMARNMRPEHAAVAATRGSLNVGRYYFRVRVLSSSSTAGQTEGTARQTEGTAGQTEGTAGQTEGTAGQTEGTAGQTEGTAGQTEDGAAGQADSGIAGQPEEQIFDIYYDRAMKNVDDRKGQWFVYREMRNAA
jgi:hypothetical protein